MDGKVVGFILGTSMLFHYGRTFEINDLAVDPVYQKRGIGAALLERCLGDKKLIVKDFPGHTPGSITLLDPALKFIYAGDASDIDIWMFTNPDCSLHTYAETGRRYYEEVKALGYTKYRGAHMPITHNISFMRDYAEWIDKLTPERALMKFNTPGGKSKLCIAVSLSRKHILFTSVYWAHQCDR